MAPTKKLSHTTALLAPLSLWFLGAGFAAAPFDTQLKERDHKSIGKVVGEYFEARKTKKGIFEAFGAVQESIEKSDKRLKKFDFMTLVEDWEQVFYQATASGLNDRGLRKGKIEERVFEGPRGAVVHYSLWLPKSYSSKKGPYPLIISIHDKGEKPTEHLDRDWADEAGRGGAIILAPRMPSSTDKWSAFDPTKPEVDGVTTLMFALKDATDTLAVDANRTFLAGRGSDAIGAALTTASTFPHVFAGVVARGEAPAVNAQNFRSVATLFVDGGENAEAFVKAVGEAGGELAKLAQGSAETELWAWIGETKRMPYPAHVTFHPTSNYSTSAYWLGGEGINVQEGPTLDARIEKEANRVIIDAENVATLRLSLNDAMVDMNEPVKIVINGIEQEIKFERNPRLMVDSIYQRGDWGRVFMAEQAFDVPAKESN